MLLYTILTAALSICLSSAGNPRLRDTFNITTCYCHQPFKTPGRTSEYYISGRYLGISYYNQHRLKLYAFNVTERITGPSIIYDLLEGNSQVFQREVCEHFERHEKLCYEKIKFDGGHFTFDHHKRSLAYSDFPHQRPYYIEASHDCADRCVDDLGLDPSIVDHGAFVSFATKSIK